MFSQNKLTSEIIVQTNKKTSTHSWKLPFASPTYQCCPSQGWTIINYFCLIVNVLEVELRLYVVFYSWPLSPSSIFVGVLLNVMCSFIWFPYYVVFCWQIRHSLSFLLWLEIWLVFHLSLSQKMCSCIQSLTCLWCPYLCISVGCMLWSRNPWT